MVSQGKDKLNVELPFNQSEHFKKLQKCFLTHTPLPKKRNVVRPFLDEFSLKFYPSKS